MALPFLPACLPTLRGTLPHSGVAAAAGLILRTSGGMATLAALPQRGARESSLAQVAVGFPGLLLDATQERATVNRDSAESAIGAIGLAYLRGERAAGMPPSEQAATVGELLRQLGASRPRLLKAELLGPISLVLQLTDEQERPLAYDPALREALMQYLALRAAWLHEQLSAVAGSALICLDEPFLDALNSPFCPLDWNEGGDLLARALDALPGLHGLATRGPVSWTALLALPVELIFFDAYEQSAGLVQAASAVADYLERGGVLGWGVVPNDPAALAQEHTETLARRFESTVEYLSAASGIGVERICGAALITTSGGLAHLPVELAEQAANRCVEVSVLLRERYGLASDGQRSVAAKGLPAPTGDGRERRSRSV